MQVSVETAQGLKRRITIAVPAEEIENQVKSRLKSLAPTVKLPGFRPGKVPFHIVEKKFGGQVRSEVVDRVISASFYEAVAKENLRPAGAPRIESQNEGAGKGLEFTASFEVYPEIQIAPVEQLTVQRPVAEVTDADLDQMLEKLRKQRVNWTVVERPAQTDDRVIVNYEATIDGKDFPGNKGQDLQIVLGSKSMIPGFEDALVGATAGQTVDTDLHFPENYHVKDIAGKKAHFKVAVNRVEAPEQPPLDDEFAASFGVKEGGVEALRKEVRGNMLRELDRVKKEKIKQQVMDALVDKNPVDVPEALVDQESERLAQQMQAQMAYYSKGQKEQQIPRHVFAEQARRRVALGLVLSEIVNRNGLKALPERVRQAVENIASAYEHPAEVVKWYFGDRSRLAEVESMVLEDQIVEWVLERAQVTDNMTSFDALMNSERAQAT